MDRHLGFMVEQTERYSSQLAVRMKQKSNILPMVPGSSPDPDLDDAESDSESNSVERNSRRARIEEVYDAGGASESKGDLIITASFSLIFYFHKISLCACNYKSYR